MVTNKYQTLSEFLATPFHRKDNVTKNNDYDKKYTEFVSQNKIRIHAMCTVEDSYYYHIKVPSESQKDNGYDYDVVIRFFSDNPDIIKQSHLRNYYIQFFSNSPSFMYQYAYLYNKGGYLISALYDKLDADYIDTPPEKTNASMTLSYDKSIYFACRYLTEKKFSHLDKLGVIALKKKSEDKFFRDISDFKSIKIDQSLMNEEKKLSKILDNKSPKSKKEPVNNGKKNATKSTSHKGITTINVVKKKTGVKAVSKKMPSRSTRHK